MRAEAGGERVQEAPKILKTFKEGTELQQCPKEINLLRQKLTSNVHFLFLFAIWDK